MKTWDPVIINYLKYYNVDCEGNSKLTTLKYCSSAHKKKEKKEKKKKSAKNILQENYYLFL